MAHRTEGDPANGNRQLSRHPQNSQRDEGQLRGIDRRCAPSSQPQVACSLTDGVDGVLRDMQFLVIDNDTLFTKHDHEQRPHQGIANDLIEPSSDEPPNGDGVVVGERLCELLRSYRRSA